jgi:hypothetical protein
MVVVRKKESSSKAHAIEYRVKCNQERGRFDVYRGEERTASFSHQQATATGIAIRAAQQEARETGEKIIVSSMRNGKQIQEWDSATQD